MRPYVKKGRVQLFARGMGVRRAALDRHGWNVELYLDDAQKAFCDKFLAEHHLGTRPLIGVQPISRELYKDYPRMSEVIENLARDYVVLVFLHLKVGLPTSP